MGWRLRPQGQVELIEQAKEDVLPRVPGQQAVDDSSARANDLSGHVDQGLTERGEVHSQQTVLFVPMFLFPTSFGWQQQRGPRFQTPGQQGDRHVGPVALQAVKRCRESLHAALELLDLVLLIAASVGIEDDFVGRSLPIVREVEKAFDIVEEPQLTATDGQVLPENNGSIGLLAVGGRVGELGHVFLHKLNVLVLALADDLLLDVSGTASTLRLDLVFGLTTESLPGIFRQVFCDFDQVVTGIRKETRAEAERA